jgi:hypothetical protein
MEFVRHGYTTLTKYASHKHDLMGEAYAAYMSEDVPLKERVNAFRDYNSMLSKEPIPSKLNHGLAMGAVGAGGLALMATPQKRLLAAGTGAVLGAAIGTLVAAKHKQDILNAQQAAKMSPPQVRSKILREAAMERRYNDDRDRSIRAVRAYNTGTRVVVNNIR